MKSATLVGLLMIVLGLGALIYQGISYKSQEKILDLGSIEATAETTKTIPISPIVGVIAVVSGVAVVIATGRTGTTAA